MTTISSLETKSEALNLIKNSKLRQHTLPVVSIFLENGEQIRKTQNSTKISCKGTWFVQIPQ